MIVLISFQSQKNLSIRRKNNLPSLEKDEFVL